MTIKYVQFRSGFGVPNPSPFCMKGEIMLKMADQEYTCEILDDPRKTPNGKLPYISDAGHVIADTAIIRRHLEDKYGVDLDPGLSDTEKAISHAMARMIEERLYWVTLYSRWIDDHNWPVIKEFWFGAMPPVIRSLVPMIALKQVKAALNGHGISRHDAKDIYAFGAQDLDALSQFLGEKSYMFGDEPTSLDAIAYPIIANAMIDALPSPLTDAAKAHVNFTPYVERCEARWFPDFRE